jgi:hypothetical protein
METWSVTWQQECFYCSYYWPTRQYVMVFRRGSSQFVSGTSQAATADVMLTERLAHRYTSLNSELKGGFIIVHLFDV